MTIWSRHEAYLSDLVCTLRDCTMKECRVILESVLDILEILLVHNGNLDPLLQELFTKPSWDVMQWRMLTLLPRDCAVSKYDI